MNEVELIGRLVLEGLVARDGTDFIFTNKYKRLLTGQQKPLEKEPEKKAVTELLSPDELLKKFIKDAEIPYRVPSPGNPNRQYTITARSKEAVKKFYDIMLNKRLNYENMVAGTKHYYKFTSYKKTLSNFILEGLLDVCTEAYEEALSNKDSGILTPPTSNRARL